MTARRCLVTGGAGLLGSNLVDLLCHDGWDVTVFSLPGTATKHLGHLPVRHLFGDIAERADMEAATAGQEVIFNVAGDTSWWNRHYARQWRTNVDGAVNVAECGLRNGVRRVVHTSTIDTIGYDPQGIADETWPDFNFGRRGYRYAESKREGERRMLAFNAKGLETVTINPGAMIGPYDVNLQFARLFADLRDRKVPGVPCGGNSFNHVAEVARAHIAAAGIGRPGERYICAGENRPYRDLFEAMGAKVGAKLPRLTFPRRAFVAYGFVEASVSRFTGKPPQVNPGMAFYLSCDAYYSSAKAVRELGYKIRPFVEGIDDSYAWLTQSGRL